MTTQTTAALTEQVELINSLLSDLNADTSACEYSGLMAEESEDGNVKLFDDYASGVMPASDAIAALKSIDPIDWNDMANSSLETAFEPVWTSLVNAGLS